MVERTARCRYLQSATIQSEWDSETSVTAAQTTSMDHVSIVSHRSVTHRIFLLCFHAFLYLFMSLPIKSFSSSSSAFAQRCARVCVRATNPDFGDSDL